MLAGSASLAGAESPGGKAGPSEVVFIAEIVALLLAGRLLGEAMQRVGQPAVIGQLIAGILLGPSVLGLMWPDAHDALFPNDPGQKAMIDALSQLGILLLLLLLTGMETDLRLVKKVGRAAVSVSLAGISVPFACGFVLGQYMPEALLPATDRRLITSLFLGTALAISSVMVMKDTALLWLMFAVIAIASIGKFGGAFGGGRLGGLNAMESLALACGMNARGSTEVIVASIGLAMGVLSRDLFTVIVAMAVITTMVMPPTLRWALSRLPIGEEERARLAREEFEARGFVTNLERLLIAVDDGAAGKFASRLAGLIAGMRGMPTTVLQVDSASKAASGKEAIKAAAQQAAEPEDEVEPINVTSRMADTSPEAAVAEEARKGYDLMVIGVAKVTADDGFDPKLSRLAHAFDGPLAIAIPRGTHLERPLRSSLSLLVPITGTEASRRAAEVALALARASGGRLSALYVASSRAGGPGQRAYAGSATRLREEAILRDVVEMAERYEVSLTTAVRIDIAPEEAIMREARRGGHNLIVMGVSRRPGKSLYFGNTAEAVLAKTDRSLLFIGSGGMSTASQGRGQKQAQETRAKQSEAAPKDDRAPAKA
jgi:nucleotide-binding universal stress UspA family protein/predicted Kef-type K+ transport protein